jgi:hypothetical protein
VTPEEIPGELLDILDRAAGKVHRRSGPVVATLAEILTRYDELKETGVARIFSKDDSFEGGKYLVQRRDGTVPDWPYLVMGAADPAVPYALRAYAGKAEEMGMDPQYVADICDLAREFEAWNLEHGDGDPDAPRHRTDDPEIIAKMKRGA